MTEGMGINQALRTIKDLVEAQRLLRAFLSAAGITPSAENFNSQPEVETND